MGWTGWAALTVLGLASTAASAQRLTPLQLRVGLEPGLGFSAVLHNPNNSVLRFSYGACGFSYRIESGGQTFTFPTKRPFEFASPCPGVIHMRQIPPRGDLKLFSVWLPAPVEAALARAHLRYTGEFHFRYAVVGSGQLSTAVFRKP